MYITKQVNLKGEHSHSLHLRIVSTSLHTLAGTMKPCSGCVRLRHMFRHLLARTAITFGSTRSIAECCLFTKVPYVARWCTST